MDRDCNGFFLQSLFNSVTQLGVRVDAALVCHDVRCIKLKDDERPYVSLRVLGGSSRCDDEEFSAQLGELRFLPSLPLDCTVRVQVWMGPSSYTNEAELYARRRSCGTVFIPLKHVAARMGGALYYNWLALDEGGGQRHRSGDEDSAEAFSQALTDGPRQIERPKVCVSICKTEDLEPSGQFPWTADAARKSRTALWSTLLRSQQQHIYMCTTQQKQLDQRSHASKGLIAEIEETRSAVASQEAELKHLRNQLRATKEAEAKAAATARAQQELRELEERSAKQLEEARHIAKSCESRATRAVEQEEQREQGLNDYLKEQFEKLEEEYTKIGEEANQKIEAANARIRAIRVERDDALRYTERREIECHGQRERREELKHEKVQLLEQKEALLKVVEDLNQMFVGAGIPISCRHSLDNITHTGATHFDSSILNASLK